MTKQIILWILLPMLISNCQAQTNKHSNNTKPVVVELFTSEGCSSCPPADKLLNKIIEDKSYAGRPIIALAFHVDYWNRFGWMDTFSSKQFTDRQIGYVRQLGLNSAYTPQIVVNGETELVGSDERSLKKRIEQSTSNNSASIVALNVSIGQYGSIKVDYQLTGDLNDLMINIALVSLHESTYVKRGENEGRILAHTNVVRQFVANDADNNNTTTTFTNNPLPTAGNRAVIAYLQNKHTLKIVAADMKTL